MVGVNIFVFSSDKSFKDAPDKNSTIIHQTASSDKNLIFQDICGQQSPIKMVDGGNAQCKGLNSAICLQPLGKRQVQEQPHKSGNAE